MDPTTIAGGVVSAAIATVLLATAAVALAAARGWIEISVKRAGLNRRLARAGISNFYADRGDFARYRRPFPLLTDYLGTARRSVRIAGHWIAHGTEMEGAASQLAAIAQSGRLVTVAVLDPTGPHLGLIAAWMDLPEAEVRERVQASLSRLVSARESLKLIEQKRFEIKVYTAVSMASVILLDAEEENGRLQLDLKPYKAPRVSSFAFEIRGPSHPLYETCRDSWLRLIDEATPFDPAIHLT